jgi:NAD(P)-dependent dehydrogenase (short-subunit alcohol dehydrogenase family)
MPTVMITGASRGLGFEFASQYAAEGWHVIACCRKPEDAAGLESLALATRDKVSVVAMDVADDDGVRNAARTLRDVPVDVLINSAGIAGVPGQSTGQIDYASWARVLEVNTMGPLRVLEAFTDNLARSERRLVA